MRNNKGKNNGMFGKTQSIETRLKMSFAKKGKSLSRNHKLNIGKANKGKIISIETKLRMSLSHIGKGIGKRPHCSGKNHHGYGELLSIKTKEKISLALSGKNHPMYGRKHSKKAVENMRNAQLGKKLSEETKIKMSFAQKGNKNHFYGKKHSDEVKKRLSIVHTGKVLTQEHKDNIGKAFTGDKHPFWRGGDKLYGIEFTSKLKHFIKKRDTYTCKLCLGKHKNQDLHVHHIDYDKFNNNPHNLITLCNVCHSKTNHNRDFWPVHLTNILIAENLLDEREEIKIS